MKQRADVKTGQGHQRWLAVISAVVFVLSIVIARGWFDRGAGPSSVGITLVARTNLSGFTFIEEPISDEAKRVLDATHIVNGQFARPNGPTYTVFLASWYAAQRERLVLETHSPDICWPNVGWTQLDEGQPSSATLTFSQIPEGSSNVASPVVSIPVECRLFRSLDGNSKELVVWFGLVGGIIIPQIGRLSPWKEEDGGYERERWRPAARKLVGQQFWHSLRRRELVRSHQFVRYSVTVTGDWREALDELKNFGPQWIDVQLEKPAHVPP